MYSRRRGTCRLASALLFVLHDNHIMTESIVERPGFAVPFHHPLMCQQQQLPRSSNPRTTSLQTSPHCYGSLLKHIQATTANSRRL